MTDTNILEKYNLIKDSAMDSNMVESVRLALSEEHVAELALSAKSREVYVIPIDCAIHTDSDYVRFDIIIVDKVNEDDDENYILQSYANGIALLRDIASRLNYKEYESVIVENASIGVTGFTSEDGNRQNVVTMITTTLDMEFNLVTKISY